MKKKNSIIVGVDQFRISLVNQLIKKIYKISS